MNTLISTGASGSAFSWITAIAMFTALLVLIALGYAATRPSDSFAGGVWYLLTRPAALLIQLIGRPLAWLGARIPGAAALFDGLLGIITADRIRAAFDRRFGDHADDLIAGRLEQYAVRRWPAEAHPQLWRRVPEDLRRPLVVDGRLPDGSHPADVFAPAFVTDELVAAGARAGTVAAAMMLVLALVFAAWKTVNLAVADSAPSPTSAVTEPSPGQLGQLDENLWTAEARTEFAREAKDYRDALMTQRLRDAQSSPLWLLLPAIFAAGVAFFAVWFGAIGAAVSARVAPFAMPTKDSIVRWKWRAEARAIEGEAFRAQLDLLDNFDKSPTVSLGKATGVFAFRGALGAPTPGQPVRMSLQDLAQHVLVLGGTGEGKTRTVLIPLLRQLLTLRGVMRNANRGALSVYATDGKGVLWKDVRKLAEDLGQGEDVVVIGANAKAGEMGVDLLEGVAPQQVADMLRSVARQLGGSSKESFWPDMAAEVIRNAATIARAWQFTESGAIYEGHAQERVYSLTTIYLLIMQPKLLQEALNGISAERVSGADALRSVDTADLDYAIGYLTTTWAEMATDTRTGIVANVTQLMSPFATNLELRKAFASGGADQLISIADAWKQIVLVNVPSLEYGVAGRIINVFLKTLLYTEARRRELADGSIGEREKLVFLADEFQDLVTADIAGLSDATFWNVARSAGVIGVIASQGVAAFEQAIGKESTSNLLLQFRSKVFLRSEDVGTIDFAQKLAGRTLRSHTFRHDHHESVAGLIAEEGDVFAMDSPAIIGESAIDRVAYAADALTWIGAAITGPRFNTYRAPFRVDTRFLPSGGFGDDGNGRLAAEQAAFWRAEDKELSMLTSGNTDAELVQPSDVLSMGRAHALMLVQRAGATRADLVRIG